MERQCRESTSTPDIKINVGYSSRLQIKAVDHLHLGRVMLRFCTEYMRCSEGFVAWWQRQGAYNTLITDSEREAGQCDPVMKALLQPNISQYCSSSRYFRNESSWACLCLNAKISWNAFNGTANIWIIRTGSVWMSRCRRCRSCTNIHLVCFSLCKRSG